MQLIAYLCPFSVAFECGEHGSNTFKVPSPLPVTTRIVELNNGTGVFYRMRDLRNFSTKKIMYNLIRQLGSKCIHFS